MPPTSMTTTTKPPPRGRQAASKPLASVTGSTASTRAKQAPSKAPERIGKSTAPSTLRVDAKQSTTKPTKAPVPKAAPTDRSTSALSHTEAIPAPNPRTSAPAPTSAPTVAPKESTNAPLEATVPKTTDDNNFPEPKPSATPPPQPQNSNDKPTPVPTSDPLQVAAQLYPWLYMTSTLDACFQTAEKTAKKDLETRAQRLAESESELSDQKTRFQAERAAEFYDALSADVFAETAPRIMQAFLAHGDACERVETEALEIALNPVKTSTEGDEEDEDWDAPLRGYVNMLDALEQLHAEALELEASIVSLTSSLEPYSELETRSSGDEPNSSGDMIGDTPAGPTAHAKTESGAQAQILGVFKACLPVMRARIANLTMAQELVDGARENASISLRMESLGLLE